MRVLFVFSGNKGISTFIRSQKDSLINNGILIEEYVIYGKGILGYLKNIKTLSRKIRSSNIDIIHAHYTFSAYITLLTFTKIPIIVSFMGTDVYGCVNDKGRRKKSGIISYLLSKWIQPFVKRIVVKSQQLASYVYLKRKLHIIPNGVDFDLFKPYDKIFSKEKLKLQKNTKHILFLGDKKNPLKNFNLIARALKCINSENISLMNVKYPIDQIELPFYYSAADVFVVTSYKEGSPNVIKEAMACNCPIVATDVGDIRKNISKTNGCYITKFDEFDLAQKIHQALRFNFRTTGRLDIQHLEINIVAQKIIDIYNEIL